MPTCCRDAVYHRLHPPGSRPISTVCGWVGCLRYWDGSRSVPESRRPETACLHLFLTTFTGRATTTSGNRSCSRWSWPRMNGISGSRGPNFHSWHSWFGTTAKIWNTSSLPRGWTLARPNEPCSLPGSISPRVIIRVLGAPTLTPFLDNSWRSWTQSRVLRPFCLCFTYLGHWGECTGRHGRTAIAQLKPDCFSKMRPSSKAALT